MRIRLLGPLQVIDSVGVDVTPGGAQQRRALVALAVSGQGGASADLLEDVLWPAGAPSANALQATISKLRRVLAPATIESDASRTYRLDGVATDLVEFDEAVGDQRWAAVESLVGDEPIPELRGHPLAEPIVARVLAARRTARLHRLERSVADDPTGSVPELEQLAATEPTDEQWAALLIRALAAGGRRREALAAYQRTRRSLVSELGLEPGAELRGLEAGLLADVDDVVAAGDVVARSTPQPAWRLPQRWSSFVGRADVIDELERLLSQRRLLTLLGPGGAGKTSTAVEAVGRIEAPAVFAALAPVSGRDGVERAVAQAVGIAEHDQVVSAVDDEALVRVAAAVADRELTIVLDNCEHVIDDAARVAQHLLAECPRLRIVATSRSPLSLGGERTYSLPPMPPSEAAALFAARAADHAVDVSADDGATVDAICDRLDGLPLAIELAAARLRMMSLSEVAAGLDDRLSLLAGGPRHAEPRQQTLRSVIDWSHDLLDDLDRVVFRRLSVFVGGASISLARRVGAGSSPEGIDVAESDVDASMERLVDQSLLRIDRSGASTRFSMLQTLRDYSTERLRAAGEFDQVRRRHADAIADDLAPALHGLISAEQPAWFERLRVERSNLEAAFATAVAARDGQLALELTVPVSWFFFIGGEIDVGAELLGIAVDLGRESEVEAPLLAHGEAMYGWMLVNGEELERGLVATERAMSLLDGVEDGFIHGLVANTHVMALFFAGQLDRAEELRHLLEAASDDADPWIRGMTAIVRGELAQYTGATHDAHRWFTEAADIFETVGDRFAYALSITEASELSEMVGEYDETRDLLTRGIAIGDEAGFTGYPLAMRARLGNVEILRGELDVAERLHTSLIDDAAASGVPWLQAMARVGLGNIARRRGDLDEAGRHLDAAWDVRRSRLVPYTRAIVLVVKGYLADQRGDAESAAALQREALAVSLDFGAPRMVAFALEGLAGAMSLVDDLDTAALAARHSGEADALRRSSGGPMPDGERYDLDRVERRLRERLGDEAYDSAFGQGARSEIAELNAMLREHYGR